MGRQLVLQLVEAGCHVATCDLSADELNETRAIALETAPNVRVTTHLCDVSSEEAILAFRDEVVAQHETDHVHLLFNNAGLSGGGSLFTDTASLLGSVLQRVLGRRVLRHPGVPRPTRRSRRGPHRQHLQRQRVLGEPRPRPPAHRVLGGQVRRQGVHRGAPHRSAGQRTTRQGLGGDAGSHRHVDRAELDASRRDTKSTTRHERSWKPSTRCSATTRRCRRPRRPR